MMYRLFIGITLFMVCAPLPAVDRLVPNTYATLIDALTQANPGDVIRITNSGTYTGNLVINKNVAIQADAGQTPTIISSGTGSDVILFDIGSAGARLGSVSGGRITINANDNLNLSTIIRTRPSSGAVTMENLLLNNPPDASLATVNGVYPGGAGQTILRKVELDGSNKIHVGVRLDNFTGGSLLAENVKIHRIRPVLSGGSLAIYASTLKGSATFRNSEIVSYREAVLIEADNGTRYDLSFENCVIRKDINNNFDTFQVRGMTNVNLYRTAIINPNQGRAFHMLPVVNATITVNQCDIIGPIGLDFDASSARTITITNSNIVATGTGINLNAITAGEVYSAHHDNVVGSPAFSTFPAGSNLVSPAVTPNYTNTSTFDFRYTTPQLLTASSTGGALGINADYSNITTIAPSPTPTPTPTPSPTPSPTPDLSSPWSQSQDQAYITAFRALYPARNPPISVDNYLALYPMTRWLGGSVTFEINRMNNGTNTVFWGLDYYMDALNVAYKALHDKVYLTENIRMINAVIAYRDDKRGVQLHDGSIAPGWGTSIYSNGNGRYVYSVHTGMAVFPILEMLYLAQNEPTVMTALGSSFNTIRDEALLSLNYFNGDYHSGPTTGEGHYRFPADYHDAFYRNVALPGNMQSALGRALWMSWKLTGNTTHRDRALAIGMYIKRRMLLATDGAWYWEYQLPTNPVAGGPVPKQTINSEDTAHAWLTAAFPAMLAAENQVFDYSEIRLMTQGILQGVGRLGQGIMLPEISGNPTRFGPSESAGSSRWLHFVPFNSNIWPLVSNYITISIASPNHMDTALLLLYRPMETNAKTWFMLE